MIQILKTTHLEYDKSGFLINLVKHETDKLYVSVRQTIQVKGKSPLVEEIKINPTVLEDIIAVLKEYQLQIPKKEALQRFNEVQKAQIQKRYLNGVSIRDLTVQFDCSEEIIQQILRNKGIVILSEEEMKPPKEFKRRRRRR